VRKFCGTAFNLLNNKRRAVMNLSGAAVQAVDATNTPTTTTPLAYGPPKITPVTNPQEYNQACRTFHRESYSTSLQRLCSFDTYNAYRLLCWGSAEYELGASFSCFTGCS
jgi:hypothetical protein